MLERENEDDENANLLERNELDDPFTKIDVQNLARRSKTMINRVDILDGRNLGEAEFNQDLLKSTPIGNYENDDLGEKMIKFDLYLMGFSKQMVAGLLANEEIQDTNQAVDMLIKGPNGWTHKYIEDKYEYGICEICGENDLDHADVK